MSGEIDSRDKTVRLGGFALVYRRRGEFDTWHFRTDCSRWPPDGSDHEEAIERLHGPLCNECRAKEDRERWPVVPLAGSAKPRAP